MKLLLYIPLVFFFITASGQVGINTHNPLATLDVQGNVKMDESLYLENPGDFDEIRGSKLLILSTTNEILEYDIAQSKYGPINYARYIFRNTSTNGLRDYDTKISTIEYIVSVQGYYFTANGNTNVLLRSNIDTANIEGYQIYAYRNQTTNTWFLRAFVNNSTFRSGTNFVDNPIDLFLNVIIYRNGFIAKSLDNITVNMGNLETGVAPLPAGF